MKVSQTICLSVGTALLLSAGLGTDLAKVVSLSAADSTLGFAYADDSPPGGAAAPLPGGVPVSGDPNSAQSPASAPGQAGTPFTSIFDPNFIPQSQGSSTAAPPQGSPQNGASPNMMPALPGYYSSGNAAPPPAGNTQNGATPGVLSAPGGYPLNGAAAPPPSLAPSAPVNPGIAPSAPAVSAPAAPIDPTAGLEDYTSRMRLAPGVTMLFPIRNGCDRNGRPLPPYTMAIQIEKRAKDCAFSFKWTMTELNATGVRAVDEASKKSSHKVSLFYKNGEQCTLTGYANAVRVSDAMYRDLKAGNSSQIELDGPFTQSTRHAVAVPLPQNIAKTEEGYLPIQIDEKKVKVRALKVVGDNPPGIAGTNSQGGWTYWILDNANFPMMLKGSGPFIWDVPIINSNGAFGNGNGGDIGGAGTKEGKRIVKDLKKNGVATTNAILFDFDSDKLKPSATPILNEVSSFLKTSPAVKVAVQGHCDNVGGMEYNMNLSRRRAKSVREYLVNSGVGSERLQSEGYGFTKHVASNKTAAGRAKNRRVVFKVTAK